MLIENFKQRKQNRLQEKQKEQFFKELTDYENKTYIFTIVNNFIYNNNLNIDYNKKLVEAFDKYSKLKTRKNVSTFSNMKNVAEFEKSKQELNNSFDILKNAVLSDDNLKYCAELFENEEKVFTPNKKLYQDIYNNMVSLKNNKNNKMENVIKK